MKKTVFFSSLLLCMVLLGGCQSKESNNDQYHIYYVNQDETELVPVEHETDKTSTEELLEEFMIALSQTPNDVNIRKPIPNDVRVLNYYIDNKQVYINFDDHYNQMDKVTEVLLRGAVVKTLTQIPGIEYVSFYVNDSPIVDGDNNPIGIMTKDSFIENAGKEINSYQRTKLTLYFANEAGDKLVEDTVDVVHSNNISMERLIVEQLIAGPTDTGLYPTIPKDTKVIDVSVKEGICYLNLDEGFLSEGYNVAEYIPIYSITDSLSELPGINKVQISINGDINTTFHGNIDLSTIFERNLDIIESNGGTNE